MTFVHFKSILDAIDINWVWSPLDKIDVVEVLQVMTTTVAKVVTIFVEIQINAVRVKIAILSIKIVTSIIIAQKISP